MSFVKNGISLPGEGDEKCCWCLPIKIGVYIIALGFFGWAFRGISWGITVLSTSVLWGVLFIVAAAPAVLAALLAFKFCKSPNDADARGEMAKGCLLCVLSMAAYAVVFLIWGLVNGGLGAAIGQLISYVIDALFYFYFMAVCNRYASQA